MFPARERNFHESGARPVRYRTPVPRPITSKAQSPIFWIENRYTTSIFLGCENPILKRTRVRPKCLRGGRARRHGGRPHIKQLEPYRNVWRNMNNQCYNSICIYLHKILCTMRSCIGEPQELDRSRGSKDVAIVHAAINNDRQAELNYLPLGFSH